MNYTVKLVDGPAGSTTMRVRNLSPGNAALVRWRVAMADLDRCHVSVITQWNEFVLRPDEEIAIDTRDLVKWLNLTALRSVKGFAVFESACVLDVSTSGRSDRLTLRTAGS